MPQKKILVDFSKISSHYDLIKCLDEVFEVNPESKVHFNIDLNCSSVLYSDHLLLLSSTINFLREKNIKVTGSFINFKEEADKVRYASRINFFQQIGFNYQENFFRHDASGRFTEIKRFDDTNSIEIYKEIMSILINKDSINQSMLEVLQYCLWEVIDNSIRHSKSDGTLDDGSGYICCQYFYYRNEIRLIIADNGQGIHQALTSHPNSDYKEFNEQESVRHSIDKGVTNSTGRGFGLWATATLVQENEGDLIIHSGDYSVDVSNNITSNKRNKWQGTYTFLRLNTNRPVDYHNIFPDDGQRNSYEEFKISLLGDIDNLW